MIKVSKLDNSYLLNFVCTIYSNLFSNTHSELKVALWNTCNFDHIYINAYKSHSYIH